MPSQFQPSTPSAPLLNAADKAQWLAEHRFGVAEYLQWDGVLHGHVAEEPAWAVAPYVSLWRVDSFEHPGTPAWWVIAGDLPDDRVSTQDAPTARDAVRAIATRWREAAACLARGEPHPAFEVASQAQADVLAPLLAARAETLLGWAAEAAAWNAVNPGA